MSCHISSSESIFFLTYIHYKVFVLQILMYLILYVSVNKFNNERIQKELLSITMDCQKYTSKKGMEVEIMYILKISSIPMYIVYFENPILLELNELFPNVYSKYNLKFPLSMTAI